MDERLKNYIKYYETRKKKYQNSEIFKNSYLTECALFDAISSCEKIDEFKSKVEEGQLPLKNAIAQVKDKEIARRDLYLKLKEFVRSQSSIEILENIDSVKNVLELVNYVNDIEQKNLTPLTIDLFSDQLYYDFDMLENLEVWENAQVPDEWKKEIEEDIQETVKEGVKDWNESILVNNRYYDPNWNYDYKLVLEEHHRRLISVPDDVLTKRIEYHKKYRGTK